MQVIVNVQLDEGETIALSADEVATQVLELVGGDPDSDVAHAHVQTVNVGSAGATGPPADVKPEPDPGQAEGEVEEPAK